jgi:hypothetical protein
MVTKALTLFYNWRRPQVPFSRAVIYVSKW